MNSKKKEEKKGGELIKVASLTLANLFMYLYKTKEEGTEIGEVN